MTGPRNTADKAIAKSPSGRIKRSERHARGPLNVRGKDDNFHYRFVNDVDDNVVSFQEDGYDVAPGKDVSVGEGRVNTASTESAHVKRISVGQGVKSVLMRKPKDWYEEDQIEKEQRIKEQELSIKREALDGKYGKLDMRRD